MYVMVYYQANSLQSNEKLKVITTILDIINRLVLYLKHDILETGFGLHLKVEPTQLASISRNSLSPEDGDRIQFPKRHVLNKRQDDG
jgi:hypothetical protein